jgi:hypothetical protein
MKAKRNVAVITTLFCAAIAQGTQKSKPGIQVDSMYEGNSVWNQIRINNIGEVGIFDTARLSRLQTNDGHEDQFGYGSPINIGEYEGRGSVFGITSPEFNGGGVNLFGMFENQNILGIVLEGAETPNDNDWLFGLQLGHKFDTDFGQTELVFGSYNLAGMNEWTMSIFNVGHYNLDSAIAFRLDEEDSKGMAVSAGTHSPDANRTTWRGLWETDFEGAHSGLFQIAFDSSSTLGYVPWGLMNHYFGWPNKKLVPNIMDFPHTPRGYRTELLAVEMGYVHSGGEDTFSFGTSVYPFELLENETGPLIPYFDIDVQINKNNNTELYGIGTLILLGDLAVDLGASFDRDSTTLFWVLTGRF